VTWSETLLYASGPGVAAVIGVALSFLVEYWRGYSALAAKAKRLVFLALCLAVPVVAALLRVAWGYAALSWEPLIWRAIQAGGAAFLTGQITHVRKLPSAPDSIDARYMGWDLLPPKDVSR